MGKKLIHIVLRDYHDDYSYQENLLSQKHRELGYEVMVITTQRYNDKNKHKAFHDVGDFTNQYGVYVSVLPNKARNNITSIFIDESIGLYDKIASFNPDIIFVHNFVYRDIRHIIRYAKKYPSVKVYADCHTDYYNSAYNTLYGRTKSLIARIRGYQLNKVAIKIWGTTPWRVEFLRKVYKLPVDKTDLLILGADEQHIENVDRDGARKTVRLKYDIPEDAFLVITGGKIDKRKQQNLLMEAVKRLQDSNVWLLIFGTPTDEMKPLIAQYDGVKNIVMPGWMSADEVYSLFFASDLAFFPGTHSVLWEQAVACSVPIVVKHWHGMEHVSVNGNAILMDDVTVDSIESVLNSLVFTEQYRLMCSKAKECAPSFFLRQIALRAIGEE